MSYPPLSDRFMLKSTPQKREWLLISITTHQESQKNDDGRIHSRTQTWKTTDTIAKCIISPDAEKVKRYHFEIIELFLRKNFPDRAAGGRIEPDPASGPLVRLNRG